MKKWFTRKSNILFLLIMGLAIVQQFPVQKNNLQQTDRIIPSRKVLSYTTGTQVDFPSRNGRNLAIFWATWCGPCKLEMERLKRSVESGSIPKDAIFAIN